MKNSVLTNSRLTANQRRLLGGWRDILDDVRDLCKSLKGLPDGCACSDGRSHLSGSCGCCHTEHREHVPDCADCDSLLAQLRPEIDGLTVDTIRFFPVVRILLHAPQLEPARADADGVERHISAVVRTFERVIVAAEEFRTGCRASHLQVLKETAADLLADANRLNQHLEGKR